MTRLHQQPRQPNHMACRSLQLSCRGDTNVPCVRSATSGADTMESSMGNKKKKSSHRRHSPFPGGGGADTQRIDRRTTHRHDCDQLSFIDHENAYFPDDAVREPVGFPGEDIGHYETRETMLLTATHTCIRHPPAPTRRESGSPI